MKLAVSTYSLSAWQRNEKKTLNDIVDWIADNAAGIEFSGISSQLGKNPLRGADNLRKHCEKKKLQIVGYCCPAELFHSSQAKLKQQIETLKKEIDIAARLGVKNMRHDVTRGFPEGWKGKRTFCVVLKHVVPAIREIADYAQQYGIKTSLENHGFYMQIPKRVQRLIETVSHENYGLTLDIGNFLCLNEQPVNAIKILAKYAIHVHLKDFHIKPKRQAPPAEQGWIYTPKSIAIRGAILGHGDIDLPACISLLRKSGYNGWLSLEFEGLEESCMGVAFGLDYAKSII